MNVGFQLEVIWRVHENYLPFFDAKITMNWRNYRQQKSGKMENFSTIFLQGYFNLKFQFAKNDC